MRPMNAHHPERESTNKYLNTGHPTLPCPISSSLTSVPAFFCCFPSSSSPFFPPETPSGCFLASVSPPTSCFASSAFAPAPFSSSVGSSATACSSFFASWWWLSFFMSLPKSSSLSMSSWYVPCSFTRPSCSTTTCEHLLTNCSWLVTKMIFLPCCCRRQITCSKMWRPVSASTADKTSSSKYTSASLYTARASATLCFCPPLRLMPFSPISVKSPPGSWRMSASRAHAAMTSL
mmetsp:Transcript_15391/g.31232  ORF Transcript_15391/g.31232 Transcript_15391/m.31232 type:complete len:234 (-) Transcript_15391:2025-2726(-)